MNHATISKAWAARNAGRRAFSKIIKAQKRCRAETLRARANIASEASLHPTLMPALGQSDLGAEMWGKRTLLGAGDRLRKAEVDQGHEAIRGEPERTFQSASGTFALTH